MTNIYATVLYYANSAAMPQHSITTYTNITHPETELTSPILTCSIDEYCVLNTPTDMSSYLSQNLTLTETIEIVPADPSVVSNKTYSINYNNTCEYTELSIVSSPATISHIVGINDEVSVDLDTQFTDSVSLSHSSDGFSYCQTARRYTLLTTGA